MSVSTSEAIWAEVCRNWSSQWCTIKGPPAIYGESPTGLALVASADFLYNGSTRQQTDISKVIKQQEQKT
jgi:hypothetical protein